MDNHTLFNMNRQENRLNSFKNWPFDDEKSSCTSENMAKAGFFHCPTDQEPDLVRCFVCSKELDCWDPDDDPMEEHKKHASQCPFIKLGKKETEMTVAEFIKLESQRKQSTVQRTLARRLKELDELSEVIINEMESIA